MGAPSLCHSATLPLRHSLLRALTHPSPEGNALLDAADNNTITELLKDPEVKAAIAAADELRRIRLRAQASLRAEQAMERLGAVLEASKDLSDPAQRTDTRRAAATLLRISSRILEGGARREAPARRESEPSFKLPPFLPGDKPWKPPPRINVGAADTVVPSIIEVLRQDHITTLKDAGNELCAGLDRPLNADAAMHTRFINQLQVSPAWHARHRPVTIGPIKMKDAGAAAQHVTYVLEDGSPSSCTFHIVPYTPNHVQGGPARQWRISAISLGDTS